MRIGGTLRVKRLRANESFRNGDSGIGEIHDELLPFVKSLIRKYPLKGADSVHLASALWLEGMTRAEMTFVASDMILLDAAKKENLVILNPQEG